MVPAMLWQVMSNWHRANPAHRNHLSLPKIWENWQRQCSEPLALIDYGFWHRQIATHRCCSEASPCTERLCLGACVLGWQRNAPAPEGPRSVGRAIRLQPCDQSSTVLWQKGNGLHSEDSPSSWLVLLVNESDQSEAALCGLGPALLTAARLQMHPMHRTFSATAIRFCWGAKEGNEHQGARDQCPVRQQHTPQPVMRLAVIMGQHWITNLRFKHMVISNDDSMTVMDEPMRETHYALLTPPAS